MKVLKGPTTKWDALLMKRTLDDVQTDSDRKLTTARTDLQRQISALQRTQEDQDEVGWYIRVRVFTRSVGV